MSSPGPNTSHCVKRLLTHCEYLFGLNPAHRKMSQHTGRQINPMVRNIRALKHGALVKQAVRIEEEIKQVK